MLYNLTLCKACSNRLVTTKTFVRLKTHYAILGIPHNANPKDIRDAYIKKTKQHHPDWNNQGARSHEAFVKINLAYEVLSKEDSRREYDCSLGLNRAGSAQRSGPYGPRSRSAPPNFYSGGQDFQHQSSYNPYYGRPANDFYSDPFSDKNYDHQFYERRSSFEREFRKERQERQKRKERKPMSREERIAAKEKHDQLKQLTAYTVFTIIIIFIIVQLFSEDDYLVQKYKEEQAKRRKMQMDKMADKVVKSMNV